MKTYYNDSLTKKSFDDKALKIEEALDYFNNLSTHKGSCIGFIDIYNEAILFNWHGINKWLVEHLVVPGELHRQCYITTKDCIPFIEKIYKGKDVALFEGFEDVPVGEFTLDQIIAFKKEDEMLLREEEPIKVKPLTSKPNSTSAKKTKPQSFQVMGRRLNKKEPISKAAPVKKTKPKTSMTMGENLNVEKAKPVLKKLIQKIAKEKPKDDTSFFQI